MDVIQRAVDDPAERIAVAIRLFLERVRDDRLWGWFMARYAPSLTDSARSDPRASSASESSPTGCDGGDSACPRRARSAT